MQPLETHSHFRPVDGQKINVARVTLLVTVDIDLFQVPGAEPACETALAPGILAGEVVSNLESIEYVMGVPEVGMVAFDTTAKRGFRTPVTREAL